jgi:hypothetical protein
MDRNISILQTVPNSKYAYIVNGILEDKSSMGMRDYYKNDGKSSYDPVIGRIQRDIKKCISNSKENRKIIETLITNITNSKRKPTDKEYKKATKANVEHWESECSKLQLAYVTYKSQVEFLTPLLDDCIFNQYLENSRRNTLKMLRDKFFMDGNKDYLEQGVTWAMEYAEKHKIKLDFDILPKY